MQLELLVTCKEYAKVVEIRYVRGLVYKVPKEQTGSWADTCTQEVVLGGRGRYSTIEVDGQRENDSASFIYALKLVWQLFRHIISLYLNTTDSPCIPSHFLPHPLAIASDCLLVPAPRPPTCSSRCSGQLTKWVGRGAPIQQTWDLSLQNSRRQMRCSCASRKS